MLKEEQLLLSRLEDLARMAADNYDYTFSDFLNLNEQTVFYHAKEQFSFVKYAFYGGAEAAERKMLAFFSEAFDKPQKWPISCIRIAPAMMKFSDKLTHRDFLGAVLNLGIERSKLGDIIIRDNIGYLLCETVMAPYIAEMLTRIKHTSVQALICELPEEVALPSFKTKQGSVSSIRLDSVIALAFNLSRSSAVKYISSGLVFVNGRLTDANSYTLKNGDIISVRKLGKFKFENTSLKSKKEKYVVKVHVYI